MRVLLVTDAYPPEIRSASHLMLELAEELRDRGHQVTVLTSWPGYNLDGDGPRDGWQEREVEGGITVLRVKTLPHHNVSFMVRGVAQLMMPRQFLKVARRHRVEADAVVVYSPPLPLGLVGRTMARRGARFLLNVQDLFPQNAVDLGVLTNPALVAFFRWLERRVYLGAHVVTVHSDGNRDHLLAGQPAAASRLAVLHNWVDVERHPPGPPAVDFRARFGIRHRRVAVFAGVMGPSQYLELVLHVAREMRDRDDLLFLLVGDGMERAALEERARSEGLDNVRFEGFVSRDLYPDLLKAADVGLVCLSPKNRTPVVPGKILEYMAAGIPVAAFLHRGSDGWGLIADAGCGTVADSARPEACTAAFRALLDDADALAGMGARGRAYAAEHFSRAACVTRLEALLDGGAP